MLARVIAGRGDERSAAGSGKRTAAAAVADLCDVYTQSGLEGSWTELLQVYDVSRTRPARHLLRILGGWPLNLPSSRVNSSAATTTICARSWR